MHNSLWSHISDMGNYSKLVEYFCQSEICTSQPPDESWNQKSQKSFPSVDALPTPYILSLSYAQLICGLQPANSVTPSELHQRLLEGTLITTSLILVPHEPQRIQAHLSQLASLLSLHQPSLTASMTGLVQAMHADQLLQNILFA